MKKMGKKTLFKGVTLIDGSGYPKNPCTTTSNVVNTAIDSNPLACAAPPISGGVVAAIIMGDAAQAKGFESIAVFTTLLVVVQGFFGYPVASIMLKKEARRLSKLFNENKLSMQNKAYEEVAVAVSEKHKISKDKIIPEMPKNLQTSFVLILNLEK